MRYAKDQYIIIIIIIIIILIMAFQCWGSFEKYLEVGQGFSFCHLLHFETECTSSSLTLWGILSFRKNIH